MRVGLFTFVLLSACGGDHKRPPLEEVPIDESTHAEAVAAVPTTSAAQTAPPPSQSVAPQAKALLQKGDRAGARALLEPRVDDKSATAEEKQLLKTICKAARDTKCLAKLK